MDKMKDKASRAPDLGPHDFSAIDSIVLLLIMYGCYNPLRDGSMAPDLD